MRFTVEIDDDLWNKATEIAPEIRQKRALLEEGLNQLIRQRAGLALIEAGGKYPNATAGRRRKSPTL